MKVTFGLLLLVGVLVACSSPVTVASPTPTPTLTSTTAPPTAVAATSTPTPVPAPTPSGFVLPTSCSYVGGPTTSNQATGVPITSWEFNCGAVPDPNAVQKLSSAFTQQGWTDCKGAGPGHGVWWKGTIETIVNQSAAGYPTLSQLARQSQDCP